MEHNVPRTETIDMVQYFIAQMLPGAIRPVLTKRGNCVATQEWDGIPCHSPGCTYVHWKYAQMLEHINQHHKDPTSDIRTLGWFWGMMRDMMMRKPLMPIFARHSMKQIARGDDRRADDFFGVAIFQIRRPNFVEIEHKLRELSHDNLVHQCDVGFSVRTRDDEPYLFLGK
jgi:hypothetical protein